MIIRELVYSFYCFSEPVPLLNVLRYSLITKACLKIFIFSGSTYIHNICSDLATVRHNSQIRLNYNALALRTTHNTVSVVIKELWRVFKSIK